MRQTVVGVFDRYANARQAAQQLRDSGFADSVFVTDEVGAAESEDRARSTEAREEGGVFAQMRQFFADLFDSNDDNEVSPYAEAVRRGGAVVKVEVEADDEAEQARSALEAAGAVDIEERASEWRASGWQEATAPSARPELKGSDAQGVEPIQRSVGNDDTLGTQGAANMGTLEGEEDDVIPVVKEDLQVGKRMVRKGGVRVYARTVDTPVEEAVELRSERADVQRRAVDRPASEADLRDLGERTIEVRETAEEPVVAKQARVVEEVVVRKKVSRRTQQISDSVRSTEVDVERLSTGTTTDDSVEQSPYRPHFDSNYANSGERWEEHEPAYRYGETLRTDTRYRGRDWSDIESDVRTDWEANNTGSAWDKFKGSIRHAWERVTD